MDCHAATDLKLSVRASFLDIYGRAEKICKRALPCISTYLNFLTQEVLYLKIEEKVESSLSALYALQVGNGSPSLSRSHFVHLAILKELALAILALHLFI